MPREVQQVYEEDLVWYAPDIDGNRDDPDPFAVQLKPLSGSAMTRLKNAAISGDVRAAKNHDLGSIWDRTQRAIIKEHVVAVRGYAILDRDGKRREATDGESLIECIEVGPASESRIVDDIVGALQRQSELDAGLVKNSDGSSSTSEQTTRKQKRPENGSVKSASDAMTVSDPSLKVSELASVSN